MLHCVDWLLSHFVCILYVFRLKHKNLRRSLRFKCEMYKLYNRSLPSLARGPSRALFSGQQADYYYFTVAGSGQNFPPDKTRYPKSVKVGLYWTFPSGFYKKHSLNLSVQRVTAICRNWIMKNLSPFCSFFWKYQKFQIFNYSSWRWILPALFELCGRIFTILDRWPARPNTAAS